MRFYTQQHPHYCGIDLHARTMYMCNLNQAGAIVFHRNMKAEPESFPKAIAPFRRDIVVAVECIFTWYRLADLCALRGELIPQAYVYPAEMRSTRNLLRLRMLLMRRQPELLAHIQLTNQQYNLSSRHREENRL